MRRLGATTPAGTGGGGDCPNAGMRDTQTIPRSLPAGTSHHTRTITGALSAALLAQGIAPPRNFVRGGIFAAQPGPCHTRPWYSVNANRAMLGCWRCGFVESVGGEV